MHKLHSVEIDVDAFGVDSEVIIPDCMSAGLDNAPELDAIITAGDLQPQVVSLVAQKVAGNFTTLALPTAIDAIGLKALGIVTSTEPGVTFYLEKFDADGVSTSGNTDRSLKISAGVVVPRRITCDHQGHATLSVDVVVAKETGNDAIVISDAATLPTITGDGLRWTLGSCKVGNKTLSNYTRLDIDLGNTVETRGVQSDVYDAYVEVRTHAPTITLTGIDPTWFSATNIPIDGLACTQANTIIYLRKRSTDGSGFVADGTEEHIKFTAAGIATVQQAFSGEAQRFSDTSLVITCIEDASSNDPIVVDTSSAIT